MPPAPPNCETSLIIANSILFMIAALVMAVYQTICVVPYHSACAAQPLLPALLTAAGLCNCLYLIVVSVLGWLVFILGTDTKLKSSKEKLCICLLACIPVVLTLVPIALNIWAGILFSRDFTVTESASNSSLTAAPTAGMRVLNPIISLDNPLHPRYCSRQLVRSVPIICSAYFLLAEAVVFLLPVAFWCYRLSCRPGQPAEKIQERVGHYNKLIEEVKATEEIADRFKPVPFMHV